MKIGSHDIGVGHPVYVLAEMGSNHEGHLWKAINLIHAAAEAGADGVKAQFFTADTMVRPEHSDYAMYKQYEVPERWLDSMKRCADEEGIDFILSVFHPSHVPIIESYVDALKIASAELGYTALLEAVAATGKPVILSTGMATAGAPIREAGMHVSIRNTAILHGVSAYPAPPEDMNLTCWPSSQESAWGANGLSDHTAEPFAAPLMAAALGASIIEKHFTLSREDDSPDAPFSIVPLELKQLATALHSAHLMLGDGNKRVMPSEEASLADKRTTEKGWLRG